MDSDINKILSASNPSQDLYVKDGKLEVRNFLSRTVRKFKPNDKDNQILKEKIDSITKHLSLEKIDRKNIGKLIGKIKQLDESQYDKDLFNQARQGLHNQLKDDNTPSEYKINELRDIKNGFSKLLKTENLGKDALVNGYNDLAAYAKKNDLTDLSNQYSQRAKDIAKLETPSKDQLKKFVLDDTLEAKANVRIAKMQHLYDIGVRGSSEKGVTGTVLVQDIKGKVLGVFKPDNKFAPTTTKVSNQFKSFLGQLSLLSKKYLAQPKAETVSFKLDQIFGIHSVPSSKITKLGGAEGAFQLSLFTARKTYAAYNAASEKGNIKEAKEAKEVLNKDSYSEKELEHFQRFAIQDFLTGNLDAHDENWYVETNKGGEITGIVGIDKANSFPETLPDEASLKTRNMYLWKEYSIANQPFTEGIKELVSGMKETDLEKLFEDNKDFFSIDMTFLTRMRFRALKEIVKSEDTNPATLGGLTSEEAYANYFSRQ